jgi:hypothetical protein
MEVFVLGTSTSNSAEELKTPDSLSLRILILVGNNTLTLVTIIMFSVSLIELSFQTAQLVKWYTNFTETKTPDSCRHIPSSTSQSHYSFWHTADHDC